MCPQLLQIGADPKRELLMLTAGNGPYDQQGFRAGGDGVGELGVGQVVGEVLFAGEEADERAALLGDVVADCAAEHGVAGLEGVEGGAQGGGAGDVKMHLAVDVGQDAQVLGEDDADHDHLDVLDRNRNKRLTRSN
jgi:hypothetical protein